MFPEWVLAVAFMAAVAAAFTQIGLVAGRRELTAQQHETDDNQALRDENAKLRAEITIWYNEAQKSDRNAIESSRRAELAERQCADARRDLETERAARIEAEQTVADGRQLFARLDEMQEKIVRLENEVRELRHARPPS